VSAAVSFPEPPFPDDDASAPRAPLRILAEDGALHFSDLKRISKSGQQYLHAVNSVFEPTPAMVLGTAVHSLVLGVQHGSKPLLRYEGERTGNAWKAFKAANQGAEILTAAEWAKAERIAESVTTDPVALPRLSGSRFETPLTWEENGVRCSTRGIDILTPADELGDLKTTASVEPEAFMRHAFKFGWPQSLAWYRRGARANGITCKGGLFLLAVETSPPFEVVDFDLTEGMITFAESCLELWFERFRVCMLSCPEPTSVKDWPGYAQSRVAFDVPAWAQVDDEEEEASE
jgi:hypothetical protein